MKIAQYFPAILIAATSLLQAQKTPQLGKDPIDAVITAMTNEEKAALVTGTGMPGIPGMPVGFVEGRVPGAAGVTFAIDRLGIPGIILADGPAGLRITPIRENSKDTFYATAFPVGTALASTWNLPLIENVGKAMGAEVRDYGVDVLLAPALNIQRNPLCGRNFEYYSEDPIVSGKTAAAMVNGIQSNGVGTSVKHFAANNQETNRLSINEHISERAMREIYLRGFETVVKEAQPWTVMSSYNKINGIYTSERKDLLTDILRDEWGFKGLVMTDWFGGYYGWAAITDPNYSSDVVAQLSSGNDLLMPGMKMQYETILSALQSGALSQKVLDLNVKKMLEGILRSPTLKKFPYNNKPDLEAHAKITREAAAEGMVLLKNEGGTLPYHVNKAELAVYGVTSYNFIAGGTGSGDVNEAYTVSLIDGLQHAGFALNGSLSALYTPYVRDWKKTDDARREKEGILAQAARMPEIEVEKSSLAQQAETASMAIITIGRNSGEGGDRVVDGNFNLAGDEIKLIDDVSSAFHAKGKKVAVILNIGGVIETASWKDKADAILLAWQPGQEGGNSVADVLTGKVNPSGKLTMSFPMRYTDVPSSKSFPGTPETDPKEVTYEEGIYVGYRYYDTFKVSTSYPFGYGLSYTQFGYGKISLSEKNFKDGMKVNLTVKNTGKTAGKEVVQLYVAAPSGSIDKPAKELKAFTKTKLLQPGESETLTFTLHNKDMASFFTGQSAWIAEKGTYQIAVGSACSDIRQTAKIMVPDTVVAEKTHKSFDLDVRFTDLKPTK